MRKRVLIKGAGDLASGTAHRLFRCGFHVIMTELEFPTAVRRAVSFSSAITDGRCEVEGVDGVRHSVDEADALSTFDWSHIPVFVDPQCRMRELFEPEVIIDGRTLKRNLDNSAADAPLVIGFGPGLVAPTDVHFVIETRRGHDLGRVISEGSASADTGVPGPIGGHTVDRILRAPAGGTLEVDRAIGDHVEAGDRIGCVGDRLLTACIGGVIRGLLFSGSHVVADQKLGDIDPRGERSSCYSLSDKTRTISGAALETIISFFANG